jgi:hypothetical protein
VVDDYLAKEEIIEMNLQENLRQKNSEWHQQLKTKKLNYTSQ